MRQEGSISEPKRGSPRLDKTPTSTKSMGLPRPVVSESKTTNSPPDKRERAHRMASSLLSIRAGEASVGMLLESCILLSSSHGTGALTTAGPLRDPIAQHSSIVSACARHPTAPVVVTPVATKGKAPAGNVFAGVTVVTLVMKDCGCYLDS